MEHMLLKEYGCLPSELDGEDVMRLLKVMNAGAFYDIARKPFERWTPAEIKTIWSTHMALKAENDRKKGRT